MDDGRSDDKTLTKKFPKLLAYIMFSAFSSSFFAVHAPMDIHDSLMLRRQLLQEVIFVRRQIRDVPRATFTGFAVPIAPSVDFRPFIIFRPVRRRFPVDRPFRLRLL